MTIFFSQLTIIIIAIVFGGFIILEPRKVIDIQIAFYRLINWKIEPISMAKEIRNTRIMGAALLIFAVLSLIYIIVKL